MRQKKKSAREQRLIRQGKSEPIPVSDDQPALSGRIDGVAAIRRGLRQAMNGVGRSFEDVLRELDVKP